MEKIKDNNTPYQQLEYFNCNAKGNICECASKNKNYDVFNWFSKSYNYKDFTIHVALMVGIVSDS